MKKHVKSVQIGAETITFETGAIARQANGACVLRSGDTVIFASACAKFEEPQSTDFLPLRVDYQEKFSSAGKTAGGYIKREGRPTERETLVCRLIDRPLRPMFEEGFYNETQILTYVWSFEGTNTLDAMAICASSAALVISDIPLIKPVAGVHVGFINGEFIVNPTFDQQEISKLDLMIAGTEDAVLMIEGSCEFLTEEQVLLAIEIGHKAIKQICIALKEWQEEIGKEKNRTFLRPLPKEIIEEVHLLTEKKLKEAIKITEKQKREEAISSIKEELLNTLAPTEEEAKHPLSYIKAAFKEVSAKIMREMILDKKVRPDGRGLEEIRPIHIDMNYLPRAHGSAVFTRGETQAVAVCTLGGSSMAQRSETLTGDKSQRFYLQYFFPPFSVGEVGRVGPPGRREVGHGKLAERSLLPILPSQDDLPYTIRLESNITESNGSSSMASVCGGCLALMDAGIKVKAIVSGIAMGLILEDDRHAILSDILGIEDALGDMDFKIAGSTDGITSFQMDIKVEGITIPIMKKALAQAKQGRMHILNEMVKVCPEPRKEMPKHAPRIETIRVKQNKIAAVIGTGGKVIRSIIEETGVEIDIDDSGLVTISSPNSSGIDRARAIIESLTADVEVGKSYQGKITKIVPFGCFVEILPGKEGLCHISEFDKMRINDLNEIAKEGDTISVIVLDINERGQLRLSRKATLV